MHAQCIARKKIIELHQRYWKIKGRAFTAESDKLILCILQICALYDLSFLLRAYGSYIYLFQEPLGPAGIRIYQ